MAWARTSVKTPFLLGSIVDRIRADRFLPDVRFGGTVHADQVLHSGVGVIGPAGSWLGPSCANRGDPGEPPDASGQTFGTFPALSISSIVGMPWKRGQIVVVLEYGRLALHDGTGFKLSGEPITCVVTRSQDTVTIESDAEPLATVRWREDGKTEFSHTAELGAVLPRTARAAYVEDRLGNKSREVAL